jgi:membrane protease YdiL (CAAX protease family)
MLFCLRMSALRRTAALLEVLGIYLAGQLVVAQLTSVLSLQPVNPLPTLTANVTDAELVTATGQVFWLLLLQYAGWFLLIAPINWWHRRQGPASYGVTKAGQSWSALVAAGLVTAALVSWPTFGLQLLDGAFGLGETAAWRQAIFDTSWRRWEFWYFVGVLSFGFVAVAEELFFRGYCQRRLSEDWGHGPAIVCVACLFTFAHSQYLLPNAYSVGMIASLLVFAVGVGVVFAWSGSLLPSIVAHAILNTPMTPSWQVVAFTAALFGGALVARRGAAVSQQVFSGAGMKGCVGLALAGLTYAIASQHLSGLVFVAAAMVVLAVGLEAWISRATLSGALPLPTR